MPSGTNVRSAEASPAARGEEQDAQRPLHQRIRTCLRGAVEDTAALPSVPALEPCATPPVQGRVATGHTPASPPQGAGATSHRPRAVHQSTRGGVRTAPADHNEDKGIPRRSPSSSPCCKPRRNITAVPVRGGVRDNAIASPRMLPHRPFIRPSRELSGLPAPRGTPLPSLPYEASRRGASFL